MCYLFTFLLVASEQLMVTILETFTITPVACFIELVRTGLLDIWEHSISALTSQEGIECKVAIR